MIRIVLAVLLSAALVATAMPAVEQGREKRANTLAKEEVTTLGATVERFARTNDPVPESEPGATRLVTVRVPDGVTMYLGDAARVRSGPADTPRETENGYEGIPPAHPGDDRAERTTGVETAPATDDLPRVRDEPASSSVSGEASTGDPDLGWTRDDAGDRVSLRVRLRCDLELGPGSHRLRLSLIRVDGQPAVTVRRFKPEDAASRWRVRTPNRRPGVSL